MVVRREIIEDLHKDFHSFTKGRLSCPAHIHHISYLIEDESHAASGIESEIKCLIGGMQIDPATIIQGEAYGAGYRTLENGDVYILKWEIHSEYYNYQFWYLPADKSKPLSFGDLETELPTLPVCFLGTKVTALDIIITDDASYVQPARLQEQLGDTIYANRVMHSDIQILTNYRPDKRNRERYLVYAGDRQTLMGRIDQVVENIGRTENYYHLLLLPLPDYLVKLNTVGVIEKRVAERTGKITETLEKASGEDLETWLKELTSELSQIHNINERLRHRFSATFHYDKIYNRALDDWRAEALGTYEPLRGVLNRKTEMITDDYQRLIQRFDAAEKAIADLISVLRTRIDLILQRQNLEMLEGMHATAKHQVKLQETVEGLSIIVISYYLTGLAGYVFKAMEKAWGLNSSLATGIFVPVAILFSFFVSRKFKKAMEKHEK
ncbi:MAG: DUF3422 domain-containing protein [Nitrospirota bacterium]|nr:DUF3422 domain-containing protein [Nitrospirota bacterium]